MKKQIIAVVIAVCSVWVGAYAIHQIHASSIPTSIRITDADILKNKHGPWEEYQRANIFDQFDTQKTSPINKGMSLADFENYGANDWLMFPVIFTCTLIFFICAVIAVKPFFDKK